MEQETFLFSVLEPELTYTLPVRQLVNGLLDTFIHVMENYLTAVEGTASNRYAESILQTLVKLHLPLVSSTQRPY